MTVLFRLSGNGLDGPRQHIKLLAQIVGKDAKADQLQAGIVV
jgi:ABC-type Fe3+-hydroxamate transport system substrate-binding protein